MQTFVDNDASYLRWVADHPAGVVINAPRAGRQPRTLHRARCSYISSPTRMNYTTTSYYKVCASDLTDIISWAAGQEEPIKICSACWREPAALTSDRSASDAGTVATVGQPPVRLALASTTGAAVPPPLEEVSASTWQLWAPGPVLQELDGIRPRLASWNANADPAQIRLRAYLEELSAVLNPAIHDRTGLFLHMDIDVEQPAHLLHHYDLENYLTPVVHHLGAARFVLASATKRVGKGSQIRVGIAVPSRTPTPDWVYFGWYHARAANNKQGQTAIRDALMRHAPAPLPPGPVAVQLAWRCGLGRNWVSFWKSTGDAMGPVLGEPYPNRPFYPNDDRIVNLSLHRNVEPALRFEVAVGMWWQPASSM